MRNNGPNWSDLPSPFQLTANRPETAASRGAGKEMEKTVDSPVRITLNGESRELPGSLTVAELVRHLGLKPEHVAVEVNKALVTRSRHAETP